MTNLIGRKAFTTIMALLGVFIFNGLAASTAQAKDFPSAPKPHELVMPDNNPATSDSDVPYVRKLTEDSEKQAAWSQIAQNISKLPRTWAEARAKVLAAPTAEEKFKLKRKDGETELQFWERAYKHPIKWKKVDGKWKYRWAKRATFEGWAYQIYTTMRDGVWTTFSEDVGCELLGGTCYKYENGEVVSYETPPMTEKAIIVYIMNSGTRGTDMAGARNRPGRSNGAR